MSKFLFVCKKIHNVTDEINTGPKFCRHCGTKFTRSNARFCSNCGMVVKQDAVGTNVQQPPVSTSQTPQTSGYSRNEPQIPQSAAATPIGRITPVKQGVYIPPDGSSSFKPLAPTTMAQPPSTRLQNNSVKRADTRVIIQIIAIAFFSHILKIFLINNYFPSIFELIYALGIYIVIITVLYLIIHNYYNSKGVYIDIVADKFSLMQALVFSSFFLTIIPFQTNANIEKSSLPDEVSVPYKTKNFIGERQLPRLTYANHYLKQRFVYWQALIMLIISMLVLYLYINASDTELKNTLRIVTIFVSGFVVSESAPIFGRSNKYMSALHKYFTFFIFLFGFAVFVIGIFSDLFLKIILSFVN